MKRRKRTHFLPAVVLKVGAQHATLSRKSTTRKFGAIRQSSTQQRTSHRKHDGTILLTLGLSSLFLVRVDRFLQYQNKQEVTDTGQEVRHDGRIQNGRQSRIERRHTWWCSWSSARGCWSWAHVIAMNAVSRPEICPSEWDQGNDWLI